MHNSKRQTNPSPSANLLPLLMWNITSSKIDDSIYGNGDGYDEDSQTIIEGKYFMGSPKKNTRCNKFTVLGSDKTHQDDTKEK